MAVAHTDGATSSAATLSAATWSDDGFLEALGPALPRLQRIARVLTGDGDTADDLVAEAVARTLPKWRSGSVDEPDAYLRRVVVNLASRRWRRLALGSRRDRFALDWLGTSIDTSEAVVERDRTLRAVMALPVRRRAVVALRFYCDLSIAEIAEALNIAEGTVKSQLSRSLEQLRDDLGAPE